MSSVKKNFLYNVIYQILTMILPLITAPYLSRVMGAEALGTYSYTYSIASYFILFSMLGTKNYGVRCISKVRDDMKKLSEEFWSIYFFQFIMSLIVCIIYIIYLFICNKEYFVINLIQGIVVISALFDISWFFFGIEKFKITVTRNIVIKLATFVLIFLFVHEKKDLWKYSFIMALGVLVNQLALWPFLKKHIRSYKVNKKRVLSHIRPNLLLFIPVIAVSLYHLMDKIMLGILSNVTQVGFYENSVKIIDIPFGIIVAFGTVMLPRMSYLVEKGDKNAIKHNIESSLEFNMFLGSAMMFGIAGIAPVFAPFFYGQEFDICGQLITYISPVIIIKSWANVIRNQYLIPNGKDKEYTLSVSLGAIVNLTINIYLIPKFGAMGAVIGTVIAEFMVCVSQTIMIWKEIEGKKYLKNSIKYLFIGILMFILVRGLSNINLKTIFLLAIQILSGGLFYIICILIIKNIGKR